MYSGIIILYRYRPGWDCHGLPIEIKVLEELKVKRGKIKIREEKSIIYIY